MNAVPPTSPVRGKTIKNDLLASIVVFLVALPLCMGVAIASGMPVAAGLITGIIGGMVVGLFAGCPLQVSGPAAGLTVIVFDIVQRQGPERLGLVVVVAGLIQVVAGVARLGQWFRAVSPAVIRGMLAGIGFLILGGQFHVILDGKPPGNGSQNLAAIPDALERAWRPIAFPDEAERGLKIAQLQQARRWQTEQGAIRQKLGSSGGTHGQPAEDPGAIDWEQLAARESSLAQQVAEALAAVKEDPPCERLDSAAIALRAAVAGIQTRDRDAALESVVAASKALDRWWEGLKSPNLAGLLGVLTIAVMIVWYEFAPKSLKIIPPALVAVIVVAGVAATWHFPVLYVDLPSSLWSSLNIPTMESMGQAAWGSVLRDGLLVAVVASAETLLCAGAVDQMHNGPRTKYDQELFAQGVGNTLCGFLGALPMTGVIVRSSANVLAGGKTRLSAILHGVWLLVFVTGMATLLRQIPTSCLAAILVYTGYKLIDVKSLRELRGYGWGEVVIYAITVSVIVFEDLLMGVLVGLGLSALKLIYTVSHLQITVEPVEGEKRMRMRLNGSATFIRLPMLASRLEKIPPGFELYVDLTDLDYIDHACLDLLHSWGTQQRLQGGELVIDWESLHARFRRDRFAKTPDVDQLPS